MSDNHDTHAAPAGDHDGHGVGPGVDVDSSPVDMVPPTPLSAFIWPGIIALLVLILLWGPVTGAFAYNLNGYNANGRPSPTPVPPTETAAPAEVPTASTPQTSNSQTVIPQPTTALSAVPTNVQGGGLATATSAPALATDTPLPTATTAATETPVPPTETAAPATATEAPASTPTTGAALPAGYADVSGGTPRTVAVAGKSFPVQISNTTLPDWVFSKDPNVASWVSGTVVNYVLGISYSDANAALFAGVHPADTIRLTRADGAVYSFTVDQVERIALSNVAPLAQDHPAITLLLLGDPAPNRALIQGHFSDSASR